MSRDSLRGDIQHGDIQHGDIQHGDIQQSDTQVVKLSAGFIRKPVKPLFQLLVITERNEPLKRAKHELCSLWTDIYMQ